MNAAARQILIVYDNKTLKGNLTPAWGFSCLIILPPYQILFDSGGDPSILLKNMHEMDIDPEKIDTVVLSHGHGDHVGGFLDSFDINMVPPSISRNLFQRDSRRR